MSYGASAYARSSQSAQSPREVEATVLMNAAARFQGIKDHWAERISDLDNALLYNRKVWTILVSAVTDPASPWPQPVRDSIATLGTFTFRRTLDVSIAPTPEKLTALININRELAAGLRTKPAVAAAPAA